MSNVKVTTVPSKPVVPQGDMGLGLCLQCLGEIIAGERLVPAFGITLAPMLWPPGRADGVPVAVPACWEHLQQTAMPRKPLLVAQGGLPK